ncbi:hypothetical protein [Luedemannella helvata]|uniref:hypothetical protein n=1 Tax=Luedemannella helvata TaxID=349315 RepID=UPI0031D82C8C
MSRKVEIVAPDHAPGPREVVFYHVSMTIENLGDRPILDLTMTGRVANWETADPQLTNVRPLLTASQQYLQPGEKAYLSLIAAQVTHLNLRSCEISWMDADGRRWRERIAPKVVNHAADREKRLQEMHPGDRVWARLVGDVPFLEDADAAGGDSA